jgi:probable HAF family extracellular repeat protein
MTDLGTLGGCCSNAFAINPAGQIVGSIVTAALKPVAVLWTDGVITELGTLGGDFNQVGGINPAGEIVGASVTGAGQFHATLWTRK